MEHTLFGSSNLPLCAFHSIPQRGRFENALRPHSTQRRSQAPQQARYARLYAVSPSALSNLCRRAGDSKTRRTSVPFVHGPPRQKKSGGFFSVSPHRSSIFPAERINLSPARQRLLYFGLPSAPAFLAHGQRYAGSLMPGIPASCHPPPVLDGHSPTGRYA